MIHQRIHTEKTFTCDHFNKSINQKTNLIRFIVTTIFPPELTLKITRWSIPGRGHFHVPNRFFFKSSHLISHQKVHTEEKPFTCDICNKSFNHRGNLICHQRMHTGENLIPCDHCDKSFPERSGLIRHQKVHTGEKSFPCDHCDKSFSERSNDTRKYILGRSHFSAVIVA